MVLKGLIAVVVLYLALLGRSAWKQGEFAQFVRSLALVTALLGAIVAFVAVFIWIDRG